MVNSQQLKGLARRLGRPLCSYGTVCQPNSNDLMKVVDFNDSNLALCFTSLGLNAPSYLAFSGCPTQNQHNHPTEGQDEEDEDLDDEDLDDEDLDDDDYDDDDYDEDDEDYDDDDDYDDEDDEPEDPDEDNRL